MTRDGQICLSKALLGSCVPSLTADEVYAEYFKPFTLLEEDTNAIDIPYTGNILQCKERNSDISKLM